jgi:hypothetical protein
MLWQAVIFGPEVGLTRRMQLTHSFTLGQAPPPSLKFRVEAACF